MKNPYELQLASIIVSTSLNTYIQDSHTNDKAVLVFVNRMHYLFATFSYKNENVTRKELKQNLKERDCSHSEEFEKNLLFLLEKNHLDICLKNNLEDEMEQYERFISRLYSYFDIYSEILFAFYTSYFSEENGREKIEDNFSQVQDDLEGRNKEQQKVFELVRDWKL